MAGPTGNPMFGQVSFARFMDALRQHLKSLNVAVVTHVPSIHAVFLEFKFSGADTAEAVAQRMKRKASHYGSTPLRVGRMAFALRERDPSPSWHLSFHCSQAPAREQQEKNLPF